TPPALCRADHRLRRLCGVGGDRTPRRPVRGSGTIIAICHAAAGNDGAWRAAGAYHRGACGTGIVRDRSRTLLPAHEYQFRPVSAAGIRAEGREWTTTARHREKPGEKAR